MNCRLLTRLAAALTALWAGSTQAATLSDLVPLQTGFTIATCYSGTTLLTPGGCYTLPLPDANAPVVAVFKTDPAELTAAPVSVPSLSYNWQFCHNEFSVQNPPLGPQHEWRAGNLGEVFGIALDDAVNQSIYVAATSAYGRATWPGSNGPGTVYRLDGGTGAITAFPQLPGAAAALGDPGPGAALGNLCYYRTPANNRWLYVSNMGDGKIYRVNPATGVWAGGVNDTFDHGLQALPNLSYPALSDNAVTTYTDARRRPWGVGVFGGRLYYSIFASMDAPPPSFLPLATGPQPEIWSVALNAAGDFLPATATREFKLPPLPTFFAWWPSTSCVPVPPQYPINMSSLPVSDIEFTLSGSMILAERYHAGAIAPNLNYPGFLTGAHSARVLEYTGTSGSWTPSPQTKFQVGVPFSNALNSAGGVGPACDGAVWCSGDALAQPFGGNYAYGIQRIRPQGNFMDSPAYLNSHLIDFDGSYAAIAKSLIGDVDTVIVPRRLNVTMVSAACPVTPGGPYTVTLNIQNLHPVTPLTQIYFGPCPPAQLPPGAQSQVPTPATVAVSIPGGGNASVNVTFNAPPIGGTICFSYSEAPLSGGGGTGGEAVNCAPKLCLQLPKCPCMDAALSNPLCPVYEGQEHSATLVITNQWPIQASWFTLAPCPINELPPNAVTLQPNPTGLQPLVPPLGLNGVSPPINITFPGLPIQNSPLTVCFIVRLLPQFENEGPFCEKKVCITFPPCPPPLPCMALSHADVKCPSAPPGNYSLNLTITNQGPVPAASAILTPCGPPAGGGVPATPSPAFLNLPPLNQGNSGTYPIQLGGLPMNGVTGCFCVTLLDAQQRPICTQVYCIALPPCPCATFSAGPVICPEFEGQPHTGTITITNTGFMPYSWAAFLPCPLNQLPPGSLPGIIPGPAGLQPLPPLAPGASITLPVIFPNVPKTGGKVCFSIVLYDENESHPLCEEKLCVDVPPCPPCKPCMSLATPAPVICPVVQGGPFTTSIMVTNLQPVPAATALLIPCLPGLAPGEVAATPIPGSVTLPPLLQNQTQAIPVALSGVASGQLACFCVQLYDAAGNKLCEMPVCLTMPQCPVLCAQVNPMEVFCQPGGAGVLATLNIQNLSASTFGWYQTCPVPAGQLPPGAVTGQPQPAGLAPFTPNVPPGGGSTVQVNLPNNIPPAGGTFCFILKFFKPNEQLVCEQKVCVTVPPCTCGAILSHTVECVPAPGGGVKRQITFTVANFTNSFGVPFSFAAATILPGAGFSPNVITPVPNPIPPGGTGTFTTCYIGNKPPRCLDVFLTNADRTRCCPLRLCPDWIECAQPVDNHNCDIASEFVSENGGIVNASGWIFNGSGTPKTFTWSVSPAVVAGCTGTLPPNAFVPASGTVGPVGPWSTIQVPFSISGASLAPGQCGGFQFCFREVSQAITPLHCCPSKVRRNRATDVCVIWDPAGRKFPTGAGLMRVAIKNPTGSPVSLSLMLGQTGNVDFSLTGEFPAAGGSADGAGGLAPAVDSGFMPFDIEIPPHGVVPLSFASRIKPVILPEVGPVFNEWYLIRLCRGSIPVDPEVIGTELFHIPLRQPGPSTPLVDRNFGFLAAGGGGWPDFLQCDSDPDEVLELLTSTGRGGWQREWPSPWHTVQAPDGTFLGSGGTVFLPNPDTRTQRRSFRTIQSTRQP